MSVKTWGSLFALALSVAACHTRPPATTPARVAPSPSAVPARPPAPPPPPRTASPAAPRPLTEAELFQRKSLDEVNAEHPLGDVFFDYDKDFLRDDGRRVLQEDLQWLTKWPTTTVRIDGHCDERGTPEYNLALGDRRATVVREYLLSLGLNASRIEMRSLGKEAPFCFENDERCWAQNRRDHFAITGK